MACEAIKGLLITTDIPMAQFIVNLNASMPNAQKFILEVEGGTEMTMKQFGGNLQEGDCWIRKFLRLDGEVAGVIEGGGL
ncbi:unnamed protein product [Calypogeia fissa]